MGDDQRGKLHLEHLHHLLLRVVVEPRRVVGSLQQLYERMRRRAARNKH